MNYSEIKQLVRELRKEDILKENELEKFQKDFIQQIHNGTVQKEKEIDLVLKTVSKRKKRTLIR